MLSSKLTFPFLIVFTLLSCNTDPAKNLAVTNPVKQELDTTQSKMPDHRAEQRFVTDLNDDGLSDTISLSSTLEDTSLFNQISIRVSGTSPRNFIARNNGWFTVDEDFLKSNPNSIPTNRLFLRKNDRGSTILLFGAMDGAGYRGDFSIITIRSKTVARVLDLDPDTIDIEIPLRLTDFDKDGRMDFLFTNLHEIYKQVDSLNADIGTYVPYLIYTIDSTCWLNMALTQKYNEVHYVWAGLQYSEQIEVLYPRDTLKKPSLWK